MLLINIWLVDRSPNSSVTLVRAGTKDNDNKCLDPFRIELVFMTDDCHVAEDSVV